MDTNNEMIFHKVEKMIENYDSEIKHVISRGLEYTKRNHLTFVSNHLKREIERMVKEINK